MKRSARRILCGLMAPWMMAVPVCAAGWDYDMSFDQTQKAIVFAFSEVSLQLPDEWEGKIALEQTENELRFYHAASHSAWRKSGKTEEENGLLFALGTAENGQLPESDAESWYRAIGSGTEGLYYLRKPEQMRGYMEETSIWDEWSELNCLMPWVTAEITGEGNAEKTQTGESQIPVEDYAALVKAGGSMQGTVLERSTDEDTMQTQILLQADDGRELTFTSCQWTGQLAGACGDHVQMTWLGDLYGAPLIQSMNRTSSRDAYDEGIKEVTGKIQSLDGDELEIRTDEGATFRLPDQMAVKPEEYTMDSTVRVEYLGEEDAAYLVRVTELAR